jgi:uncharacterized protein YkwD
MLPPLAAEPRLTAAAKAHAEDMAAHKKLAHEGSDGSAPADRVKRQWYIYLKTGENVADGQETVESVMTAWMDSPHHRENILGDFTEIGVARARAGDGMPYWSVEFGRPFPRFDPDKAEQELAERLNHVRADASAKPLHVSPRLSKAARAIAADYAKNQPRSSDTAKVEEKKDAPKPPDAMERIRESGYRYMRITETGTFGTPTPEETLRTLLAVEAQKATLLGKDYADLGIGYALAPDGRPAWVIILAKPLR